MSTLADGSPSRGKTIREWAVFFVGWREAYLRYAPTTYLASVCYWQNVRAGVAGKRYVNDKLPRLVHLENSIALDAVGDRDGAWAEAEIWLQLGGGLEDLGVKLMSLVRSKLCSDCRGTGRVEDAFCDCALGISAKRFASKKGK